MSCAREEEWLAAEAFPPCHTFVAHLFHRAGGPWRRARAGCAALLQVCADKGDGLWQQRPAGCWANARHGHATRTRSAGARQACVSLGPSDRSNASSHLLVVLLCRPHVKQRFYGRLDQRPALQELKDMEVREHYCSQARQEQSARAPRRAAVPHRTARLTAAVSCGSFSHIL